MKKLTKEKFHLDFHGKPLTLEVSPLAGQANAAVVGSYGETTVLATVVMDKEDKDMPYFPLSVDYEEKFYAAGKIMGSRFMRREGRPSDNAILTGRLIDRSIRPLFDHGIRRGVQVIVSILSYDEINDPDFIALLAASTALSISDIPWKGPVGCIRAFQKNDGEVIFNPTASELNSNDWSFHVFAAGTADKINMLELEGLEGKEKNVQEALKGAQAEIAKLVEFQKEIVKKIGKEKEVIEIKRATPTTQELMRRVTKDKLEKIIHIEEKDERKHQFHLLKTEIEEMLKEHDVDSSELHGLEEFLDKESNIAIHKKILEKEERLDGRKLDEIRPLYADVALLKRTHGSGLFMRGDTQALAITTLGPPGAEQLVENVEFSGKRRFMLHYNFPPYSVGETRFLRGPGRREIGHGALAKKAIENMLPEKEEFPYTIRTVSETLSSDGSSSMAAVCATTLSLMDAGVKIKKPIAGIAMGLMTDDALGKKDGAFKILTDIKGLEDHFGDMDFKVAGTRDGITAMQLDVKIEGVTDEVIGEVLEKARAARVKILDVIAEALPSPREELSQYAPHILTIKINPERIGEVIGPGGKVINGIIEKTEVLSIDIEDDGMVYVTGNDKSSAETALAEVEAIVKEYTVGEVVTGKVVRTLEFGAIVEFAPNRDGMIHVSELKEGFVKNVEDVVKVGDEVTAKIIKAEPDGKIGLSIKALDEKK